MSFVSNYNAVRDGVCSVTSDIGVGTGWLYRRQNNRLPDKTIYVVTAAHVVYDQVNDIIYNPMVLIQNVNKSNKNQIFQTLVISLDKKGDIALLEIQNHRGVGNKFPTNWPNHTTLIVNTSRQSIGIPIYIVGYPLGNDYNSFAGGYLRESNVSDNFTPTSLYYNLSTSVGNSGSPVFNTNNQVIGMLQWGMNNVINGGIRGDILYFFLERSISDFLMNKTYSSIFKKNSINIFDNIISSFQPLSGELIQSLYNNFGLAIGYLNGGKEVNGILVIYEDFPTNFVIESVRYQDNTNAWKTIFLSSSIFDKSSIWEVNYFAKPNSVVTLNIYDISDFSNFSMNVTLIEMSTLIDKFLIPGFSKKDKYNAILNKIKNPDDITIIKQKILDCSAKCMSFINSLSLEKIDK